MVWSLDCRTGMRGLWVVGMGRISGVWMDGWILWHLFCALAKVGGWYIRGGFRFGA